LDKVLQAAKLVWPQVSKDTKIIPTRATSVIVVLDEMSAEWYEENELRELSVDGFFGPRPEFGQVTIELERHDEFDFEAGYDAKYDILAICHGNNGEQVG
jgi:hypothetical protein